MDIVVIGAHFLKACSSEATYGVIVRAWGGGNGKYVRRIYCESHCEDKNLERKTRPLGIPVGDEGRVK